jgi:ubiquinone/menaquinone biosynthesis C-methylase UbiE
MNLIDKLEDPTAMSKEQVKQQFAQSAASYAVSKVHAQGASLKRVVELVGPQATWQVLDVATGPGHTAFAFAPYVAQVLATDITPEMLAEGERLAQERGIHNVTFQEADAEALPFGDASFDLVTCRIAPHHFGDVARFVREAVRVLRPAGVLAVVDNLVPGSDIADGDGEAQRAAGQYINELEKLRDPSHNRCLSMSEWTGLFAAAGLQAIHSERAPKAIDFTEWARRMKVSDATFAELRQRLLHAPPLAAAALAVIPQGDDLRFHLDEAIVVGHRAVLD